MWLNVFWEVELVSEWIGLLWDESTLRDIILCEIYSRIKIDSKFAYSGLELLKHVRHFDVLLQILITHWWLPAA